MTSFLAKCGGNCEATGNQLVIHRQSSCTETMAADYNETATILAQTENWKPIDLCVTVTTAHQLAAKRHIAMAAYRKKVRTAAAVRGGVPARAMIMIWADSLSVAIAIVRT